MRRWDTIALIGMLFPPSIAIVFYIYIGGFNRMLGDDYCTMYIGQRLGLMRSVWYWYISWHGGFSASAADWVLSFLGSQAFPYHTFFFLLAWVLFGTITAKKALDSRGYLIHGLFPALLLAVLLVFTTLRMSPDISGSLFWWGGARGYLSPLILFTAYFALYYQFILSSPNRAHSALWLFISFGYIFLTGGFSETFTPVMVVLFAGVVGIRWLLTKFGEHDASLDFLIAGFFGALFSLFVMILAPGNSIRQSYFSAPANIFEILSVGFAGYLDFLYRVLGLPYLLSGLLGSTFGAIWLGRRISQESTIAQPQAAWWPIILLSGFILAFGCFLPAAYGTSEPPPGRSLITPAFYLAASFIISGFLFGEWLTNRMQIVRGFSPILLSIALCLITLSSYGSFRNLYSVRSEHVTFADQWDRVDTMIKTAKNLGLNEVNIPAMKNWANVEYPTDNPRYWPNICYSKFYDINVLGPVPQP